MRLLKGLTDLWETARSVLPLVTALAFFQLVVLRKPLKNVKEFLIGVLLSVFGLHLFLKGVSMSLLPLGDLVGENLVVLERKWLIVLVTFIIGYFGTLVEPALKTLALEVEEISVGAIPHSVLIHTVAIGFGAGMSVGVYKILNNISYVKVVVPLLLIILVLIFFAPEEFVSIAMDSASATTGPVNIPLNMALAIGLAKILENVDPLLSGFGIVGLTSIGSVISVLILGILVRL
ncbi:MAG TPA: DUF1538 domain-containing protein [Dictyoglomaceae bacterium]|nr:DUF1538 domain-containing protein [Dictyoglomaceae bacterium]